MIPDVILRTSSKPKHLHGGTLYFYQKKKNNKSNQ